MGRTNQHGINACLTILCPRSNTLEQIFDVLRGSTIVERSKDVDSNFWETYQKVSTEYDDDFLARANDDMGIILTFVRFYLNLVQYKPDRRTRLVYSQL